MLTGELAEQLERLGTMVVNTITDDGQILTGIRVNVIMYPDMVFGGIIEARPTGTPKTASQTARELAQLDAEGEALICFLPVDGDSFVYFTIRDISPDSDTHTVTINLGDFHTC
jgi:hypothetical protein